MTKCADCWKPLAADEIEYYGHTCNDCEGKQMEALDRDMREGIAKSASSPMSCSMPKELADCQHDNEHLCKRLVQLEHIMEQAICEWKESGREAPDWVHDASDYFRYRH